MNPEHFEILQQGVPAFNAWRRDNPTVCPDLERAPIGDFALKAINLSGANLTGVDLSDQILNEADLSGAILHYTSFYNVDLIKARLDGAAVHFASWLGCNFSDASLIRTEFLQLTASQIGFCGANLRNVEFYGALLSEVDFSGAELSDSIWVGTTVMEGRFERSRVAGMSFAGVALVDCELSGALGLEKIVDTKNSTLGVDTLWKNKGLLPESFLRAMQVPPELLPLILTYESPTMPNHPQPQAPMISPVIPDRLYRSARPGRFVPGVDRYNVPAATVDDWISEARALGIRRIICLLDDVQLAYYTQVPGGLVPYYKVNGFHVDHLPTRDHHQIPQAVLASAYQSFVASPEDKVVIHCSAGMTRTTSVIDYIQAQIKQHQHQHQHQPPAPLEARIQTRLSAYRGPRSVDHFHRVTANALKIYDVLKERHGLPPRFRRVLWAAAEMHDLGTQIGPEKHGWLSAGEILDQNLGDGMASAPEIAMVASLHRTEAPNTADGIGAVHPQSLSEVGGSIPPALLKLAGILRVADGLDRHEPTLVTDVGLEGDSLVILGTGAGWDLSFQQAVRKSALLTRQLGVTLAVQPAPLAVFDLQGTLIHDQQPKGARRGAVALLQRLLDLGWGVAIVSSHDQQRAQELCKGAGLPGAIPILGGDPRHLLVKRVLAQAGSNRLVWYIDDKPTGIEEVLQLGEESLANRIIPFVGSGRYAQKMASPQFKQLCQRNNLSIVEDIEGLALRLLPVR